MNTSASTMLKPTEKIESASVSFENIANRVGKLNRK